MTGSERKAVGKNMRAILVHLHRDEQGGMLDYAMVFAFVAVPLLFLFEKLFDVLSDYFGMIAFFVTWPLI